MKKTISNYRNILAALVILVIGCVAVIYVVFSLGAISAQAASSNVEILVETVHRTQTTVWIIAGCSVVVIVILGLSILNNVSKRNFWYESLLDSIPFPISVTDNEMNWTFVNKPVEGMLKIKRRDVLGQKCENWNASICRTENCGIARLKKGQLQTYFEQFGSDFKVDTAYIMDKKGRKVGHIEVVQDISSLTGINKEIKKLFLEIVEAANQVASSSQQLSDGSQVLAQGATEQSAAIQELTEMLESIGRQSSENAETASRANTLSIAAKNDAITGNERMKTMQSAMADINESSQNISKIIKVIDDIAFQTNILALNAAVEAARAGEHGKGFAVVAQEVKDLAEKSANAAKDTTALIEGTITKVGAGRIIADETADALKSIVGGVEKAVELVGTISDESNRQSTRIVEVNLGIEQLSQVVHSNSATAEESAAASEELSSQAELLRSMISSFNSSRS